MSRTDVQPVFDVISESSRDHLHGYFGGCNSGEDTEYLDHAITFERMTAEEDDPVLKAKFEKPATAYRKLVKERAVHWACQSQACLKRNLLERTPRDRPLRNLPTINERPSRSASPMYALGDGS
jgi:hypothetical protein